MVANENAISVANDYENAIASKSRGVCNENALILGGVLTLDCWAVASRLFGLAGHTTISKGKPLV